MARDVEILRFDNPDEVLDMKEAGGIAIVGTSSGVRGMRAIFEPGWTWERDEKPLLGSPDACPMHHTGYCMKGTLVVRMTETGDETRIVSGDFFEIPPGHDGYVEGDESVELILFVAAGRGH